MKLRLLFAALVAVAPTVILAVAASVVLAVAPAKAGAQRAPGDSLSSAITTEIDRVFAQYGPTTPGCGVGILRDGRAIFRRAYGMSNLEYNVPNTTETVFESGSVAKQFTAALVTMLAHDGRLSLDDDVRKWLPELPDFGKRITVRNLLTHTSGLRDQWELLGLAGMGPGSQVHDLDYILDLIGHQRALNFDPGSEYSYSNTGYALAAIIASRAGGKPFTQLSNERLFRQLGMTHTQWRDDFTRIVPNRATAYARDRDSTWHLDMPFTNVHGNGGLLFTVDDALRWLVGLDSADVLGRDVVRQMETPMRLNSGRNITYALGLTVDQYRGMRQVSHTGATAGYRTYLGRFPDQHLGLAVLCNAANANTTALARAVVNLILPTAATPVPVVASDPSTWVGWRGTYRDRTRDALVRVDTGRGYLTIASVPGGGAPARYVPVGPSRFRAFAGDPDIVFEPIPNGVRIRRITTTGDTLVYERVNVAKPALAALRAYTGTYHSSELALSLVVALDRDTLVVRRRPNVRMALQPAFSDAFTNGDLGTVRFTRDRSGRVDGFVVSAGRIRNVRFDREK